MIDILTHVAAFVAGAIVLALVLPPRADDQRAEADRLSAELELANLARAELREKLRKMEQSHE